METYSHLRRRRKHPRPDSAARALCRKRSLVCRRRRDRHTEGGRSEGTLLAIADHSQAAELVVLAGAGSRCIAPDCLSPRPQPARGSQWSRSPHPIEMTASPGVGSSYTTDPRTSSNRPNLLSGLRKAFEAHFLRQDAPSYWEPK